MYIDLTGPTVTAIPVKYDPHKKIVPLLAALYHTWVLIKRYFVDFQISWYLYSTLSPWKMGKEGGGGTSGAVNWWIYLYKAPLPWLFSCVCFHCLHYFDFSPPFVFTLENGEGGRRGGDIRSSELMDPLVCSTKDPPPWNKFSQFFTSIVRIFYIS